MPTQVKLPDGNIGEFPDGMSNDQIQVVLQKQYPPSNPSPVQQNQQQTSGMADSFWAGVDGFNRQFEKLALGTLQLGNNIGKAFGGGQDAQQFEQQLNTLNQKGSSNGLVVGNEQSDKDIQQHPYSYLAGATTGLLGQGAAAGMSATGLASSILGEGAGGLAARTLGNAIAGGAMGITSPADSLKANLLNGALGTVVGVAAGAPAEIWGAAKNSLGRIKSNQGSTVGTIGRVFDDNNAAAKDAAYMADTSINGQAAGTGQTNLGQTLDDFNNLGMQGTLGQITGDGRMQTIEQATAQGIKRNRQVSQFTDTQNQQLTGHIANAVDNMASQETKDFVNQVRPQLVNTSISDGATNNLLQDSNVSSFLQNMPNNIVKQFGDQQVNVSALPNNSIAKLDYIKQNIDDKLFSDKYAVGENKMPTQQRDSLMQTRNNIVNTIDNEAGDMYQPYRQAAQKVAIQNNYKDLLSNVPNVKGDPLQFTPQDSLNNIKGVTNTLWGDDNKISAFLDDVKTTGGDVENAKAIINVSNILSKNTLKQSLNKYPELYRRWSKESFIDNIINGNYKDALINLTLSGQNNWAPLIQRQIVRQATPEGKIAGFIKLLGRASIAAGRSQTATGINGMVGGALGATIGNGVLGNNQ